MRAIPPDVAIKRPKVLVNTDATVVTIWAETVTREHPGGSGQQFRMAMGADDAMRLLNILLAVQKRHELKTSDSSVCADNIPALSVHH